MQTVEQEQLAIEGGPRTVDYKFPTNSDISGRMFGDEEIAELTEVIRSGNLNVLGGPKVTQFEDEWKKTFGVKHAVTSTSGTSALHVGVLAVGPNPGDEIIVAPITDIGSIIAILYQLAVPVFADVDPISGIITAETIEPCITERTVAIMVVHLQGNAAVMDPIVELARKHNLLVIEDCSQAHMAAYNGRYAGTIGDIGCYSFQQSKHMTTGDGGMTVTNNDYLGERIMLAHNKGRGRSGRENQPPFLAPNYRMTELQGPSAWRNCASCRPYGPAHEVGQHAERPGRRRARHHPAARADAGKHPRLLELVPHCEAGRTECRLGRLVAGLCP